MEITTQHTVSELKKTMPETLDREITVEFNWKNWNLLDTTDVWTKDGWLVTAAFSPNTLGLRQGDQQVVATMDSDEPLFFNMNPKIKHYGI